MREPLKKHAERLRVEYDVLDAAYSIVQSRATDPAVYQTFQGVRDRAAIELSIAQKALADFDKESR